MRGSDIQVGERVLVKIMAFEGRHKLKDKWSDTVYIVVRQPNEGIPVYEVEPESGEGTKRTRHRNLLLPIGSICEDSERGKSDSSTNESVGSTQGQRDKPIPKPRIKGKRAVQVREAETEDSESDEEVQVVMIPSADSNTERVVDGSSVTSEDEVVDTLEQPGDDLCTAEESMVADHSGDAHDSEVDEGDQMPGGSTVQQGY